MCYIGCQNMSENSGCETDILITSPCAVIIVLIMLHRNFFFFFFFIFLGDYAKQNIVLIITDTWATLFHSSYEAVLPQMINTTSLFNIQHTFLCSFLKKWANDNPVYSMFTVCVIKQLPVYICSLIYCSAWSESPTCYFSKYFGLNVILFDRMTITGIKGEADDSQTSGVLWHLLETQLNPRVMASLGFHAFPLIP